MKIEPAKDLAVYKLAYRLAMKISTLTADFRFL